VGLREAPQQASQLDGARRLPTAKVRPLEAIRK
jgi:hypothetical protein